MFNISISWYYLNVGSCTISENMKTLNSNVVNNLCQTADECNCTALVEIIEST